MIIGIPKEIKNNENRVALTPSGAQELTKRGHKVYVGAGECIQSHLIEIIQCRGEDKALRT